MPKFTNRDRMCIMQEQAMWSIADSLKSASDSVDNAWSERIEALQDQAVVIARELREYNDQFEVGDDE